MIVLWQNHRAQSSVDVPEDAKDALGGEVNNYALLLGQCKLQYIHRSGCCKPGQETKLPQALQALPGCRLGPSPIGGLVLSRGR